MSATLLLQYLRQLRAEDAVVPTYRGTLPPVSVLQQQAWKDAFVFAYEPSQKQQPHGGIAAGRSAGRGEFLATLLADGWPARVEGGLPLCAVGSSVLASDEPDSDSGAPSQRQYLVGTRYELASTVFAVERYTAIAVPAAAARDCCYGGSGGSAAAALVAAMAAATAQGSAELSAVEEEAEGLQAEAAAAAAAATAGVVSAGRALDGLTFLQKQDARVLFTVCRVVSTAGGAVPDCPTALCHVLRISGAASTATAAGSGNLSVRFHAFLHSPTPLLGADEAARGLAWRRAREAAPSISEAAAAGVASFMDGAYAKAAGRRSASPAMSEQGHSITEGGSRQPSTPADGDGSGLRGRGGVGRLGRGPGSADTSLNSNGTATGSVQVRWGATPPGAGSVNTSGSGCDGAAAGPVGVTPLPTFPRGRCSRLSASAAAADSDSGAGVMAEIFAECGRFTSPSSLAARCGSLHWQLSAVESLFAPCPPYAHTTAAARASGAFGETTLTEGWQRWAAACRGGLSRPLIVNSMDDITAYCEGSREAFFCAAALLDYFVERTAADPQSVCTGFINMMRACRRQSGRWGNGSNEPIAQASEKDMCDFFTQVICVCCMLGCKLKDTYTPLLRKLLDCLNSNSDGGADGGRITDYEFSLLELFLLRHVFRFENLIRMVTVNEVVDLLLFLVGGDEVREFSQFSIYARLLRRRGADNGLLATQVAARTARSEAGLHRHRRDYVDRVYAAAAADAAETAGPAFNGRHRPEDDNGGDRDGNGNKDEAENEECGASQKHPDEEQLPPAAATTAGPAISAAAGVCVPPLTKDDVLEWQRLQKLARFVSDLCVRGPKSTVEVAAAVDRAVAGDLGACSPATAAAVRELTSASSTSGAGGVRLAFGSEELRTEVAKRETVHCQCRPLELTPCTLGVAILAVTAEVLRVPMPVPLFAVMPEAYKEKLRANGLAPTPAGNTTAAAATAGSMGRPFTGGDNEESLLSAPSQPARPSTGGNSGSDDSTAAATARKSSCFPVQPHDDLYLVLAQFCSLLARMQLSEEEVATATATGGSSTALDRAIDEVHRIYREIREGGQCDPILRKRYEGLLSL